MGGTRAAVAFFSVGVALGVFLPLSAQTIALVPVVSGLDQPVYVTHAGDGSGRLFIVEQGGVIRIWNGSQLLAGPFLDIRNLVSCCNERGLLSVAFHPSYSGNGFFYVNYTDNNGDTMVVRYSVSGNPNVADAGSAFTVLMVPQDFSNHNGGQLQFGPNDGYLYIGMGDGGGSGDPNNRGQSLDTLLGKMLRIDVDGGSPYAIPADNPFVGIAGEDEIWAYGLRNPWRFSFDRLTGDLFIGDVGQNSFEEVDFQPANSSGCENYGWRRMEASACFDPPKNCNPGTPSGCNPTGDLVLPILEYGHQNMPCDSVTGGYRYRGTEVPGIDGRYLYADYCRGTIWAAREFILLGPPLQEGEPPPPPVVFWEANLLLDNNFFLSSFGEDESGELYVVDIGGTIFKIAAPLALSPSSGSYVSTQELDLVLQIFLAEVDIGSFELRLDGRLLGADESGCGIRGRTPHGGQTVRCPDFSRLLSPGRHEIIAAVELRDGRRFTADVVWQVGAATER